MSPYQLRKNPYQGNYPRALFVCSAGMLRSATACHVMAGHGWNTRCAGTEEYAIQPLHPNTMDWAQEIYCMEAYHADHIPDRFKDKVIVLDILDVYTYRHPDLIAVIEEKLLGSS